MKKPEYVFDREWEWAQLRRFVTDARPGATLGVVGGRRRQGKSLLLHAVAAAQRGFYYETVDGTTAEILRDLGSKLADFTGSPAPLAFPSSESALAALLELGARASPLPVIVDEFPAWAAADPMVPSLVRNALGPGGGGRSRTRTRLLLCGSALRFMGNLLGGASPLRGRAGLELVVSAFDYRAAREFWGLRDLALAVKVFAIVGGTPAYRREFVADDVPDGPRDFDAWVVRTALNPAVPLFREGRYLLAEDPAIGDLALYHSVLAAIAGGQTTSAKIAARLGRAATALAHPLSVLADAGFVEREQDAFHAKKVRYAITEPLIVFHHAILRPNWSELERPGRTRDVWRRVQPRFSSEVVGPAFEAMCRTWAARFAEEGTFDGPIRAVRRGLVPDAGERRTHEVDIVALGDRDRVLGIGEAKWGAPMDRTDLARLRHIADLLGARGHDVRDARLVCCGGGGFSADLRAASRTDRVVLVDLERLYG